MVLYIRTYYVAQKDRYKKFVDADTSNQLKISQVFKNFVFHKN